MTRYQPLLLWNGNFFEANNHPFHDRKDLVRVASFLRNKWSKNVHIFYLEWDDERPDELPLVRRFSNKELLGGEE